MINRTEEGLQRQEESGEGWKVNIQREDRWMEKERKNENFTKQDF